MKKQTISATIPILIWLVAGLLLTACNDSSRYANSGANRDDQFDPSAVLAPIADEIVIVLRDEPVNLAWHATGTEAISVTRNTYEPLVTRAANGELAPSLAESWDRIDDYTWRFHLRHGVTFHDGEPFDAQAVAWHIDRLSDPDFAADVLEKMAETLLTSVVIDEFTIDIRTESPEPIFPRYMYWLFMGSPRAAEGESDRQRMIGTGPYKLAVLNQGESLVLAANPEYWGGIPAIKRVTFIWREEADLRQAMVRASDADIGQALLPPEDSSIRILTADIPETAFLLMDPHPPLDDIRVRRAICMALDRDALVQDVFSGFVRPASQLITPDVTGYNADILLWSYDPDQARTLIEEARADGVSVDLPISIMGRTGIYANASEAMEDLQLRLVEIGLNAKLEMLDTPTWKTHIRAIPRPDDRRAIFQSSHGNEAGDGIFTMLAYYESNAFKNSFPDSFQDDLVSAAAPLTGDDRQQALAKVLAYQHDELVQDVPMVHFQAIWGVTERVVWEPRFDGLILVKSISLN